MHSLNLLGLGRRRTCLHLCWMSLALLLSGCGDAANLSTVEGKVSVDGKPVPKGSVIFTPMNGGQPISADIVDGKYRAEKVSRGANRAHLNAFYLTGGKFVEFGIEYPEEKNLIPAKYQAGIDIQIEDASVVHDFDLTAK